MSVFIEKIVKKSKTAYDYMSTAGLMILGLIIVAASLLFKVTFTFAPLIIALVGYGLYMFIKYNNVEFEYSVLNGDIDIDKILGMSRRKRLFSASCKEFEAFGELGGPEHARFANAGGREKLYAVSSMNDSGIYFFTANYEDKKYIVYFQPDDRMLENFKLYNPMLMRGISAGDNV